MRTTAVLMLALAAPSAAGQPAESMRRAVSATVRIVAGAFDADGQFAGQTWGSGVIISAEGLVLTNHHVVFGEDGRRQPQVWAGLVDPDRQFVPPNRAVPLQVVRTDPARDLVLARLPRREGGGYPHLRLGETSSIYYGSRLHIIGFPSVGGPTTTVTEASVLGMDEGEGWIKVDGGLMRGVSGGAAVDERGDLIGIPTRVVADQQVPFFGDQDVPMGSMMMGAVGFVRSIDEVRAFLGASVNSPTPVPAIAFPAPAGTIAVRGAVTDKASGKAIPGAVVGFLRPGSSPAPGEIRGEDLVAFAKADFEGRFALNRKVREGRYVVKVVHPQYRSLVQSVDVTRDQSVFDVTLAREGQ